MDTKKTEASKSDARKPYVKPRLIRWGTLRELTLGGGGTKNEPGKGTQKTRF